LNPEISRLGCCQLGDPGFAKMAGIPRFGILGLQSLVTIVSIGLAKFWCKCCAAPTFTSQFSMPGLLALPVERNQAESTSK